MPATANIIGKVANGIGDDLISTSIISSNSPVVFVPSMNEAMWLNKIVQNNVRKLRDYGYYVIEPSEGVEVSDSKHGYGAMPPIKIVLEKLVTIVKKK